MSYQPPVNPNAQHHQHQPPTFTPPPPKKKTNTGLIIGVVCAVFAALCGVGVLAVALAGTPDTTTTADKQTNQAGETPAGDQPKAPKGYKIGQPVRGGDLQFTVHGMKCGIAQVGNEYLKHKAQGVFCRADVSVKNVGKSAELFHADSTVKAEDAAGTQYSADGEAGIYGNREGEGFLDEINPGNSVRAFVFFDVPKGTKLTTIVLTAGLFSLAEDAEVAL